MSTKLGFLAVMWLVPLSAQWTNPKSSAPRTKDGAPDLKAPAPPRADGKPDLTGIWIADPPKLRNVTIELKPGELQMQPWAEKLFKERETGELSALDPDANYLPQGVSKINTTPLPFKIFQEPNVVVVLYEALDQFRQFFLDGGSCRMTPIPNGSGTLWRDGMEILWSSNRPASTVKRGVDQVGHPSTEQLRVTERFRRPDFGHMDVTSTIDDPGAYRKPWTFTQPLTLLPDTELLELVCNENNKVCPTSRVSRGVRNVVPGDLAMVLAKQFD